MKFREIQCFKSYDVRGRIGQDIDEDIVYRVARSLAQFLLAKTVVVGFDARETSEKYAEMVVSGLNDAGADSLFIGLAGTEEMYCAVNVFDACAGIEITASHNPKDYNGLKMVKAGAAPLDFEKELKFIKQSAENGEWPNKKKGKNLDISNIARKKYIKKVLDIVDLKPSKPLRVLVNCGNGAIGPAFIKLKEKLKNQKHEIEFISLLQEPDSNFPYGVPNPLIEKQQEFTGRMVRKNKADFGVAFDGDFDRCFFFDENGNFIAGEYIVGFLAELFLQIEPNATIIHDPRVIWNIQEIIEDNDGVALLSRTGHSYFKEEMRRHNAIYGGEISAHHYFRDFFYCDSGMITFLKMLGYLSKIDETLGDITIKRSKQFVSSGEKNFRVENPDLLISRMIDAFGENAVVEKKDGVSFSFNNWRFNLRKSNTEPLLRLNIEARDCDGILKEKLREIEKFINDYDVL